MSDVPPTVYRSGLGYCLILNNVNFQPDYLDVRLGSDKDAEDLQSVFSERNFIVGKFKDRTADQMRQHIVTLQQQRTVDYYNKFDRLFIFFLSHGYQGNVCGTDGSTLSISEMLDLLSDANCPAFAGKPRVLVFQCCRIVINGDTCRPCPAISLGCDFSLAYATQPHSQSFRHILDGTYYIQCLVEVIREKGEDKDWSGMLKTVNERMMAHHDDVQYPPEERTTLRESIYLKKRRNSQMIVPAKIGSVSSIERDEMVTPSSSLTELSPNSSRLRTYCPTWPIRCRKRRYPKDQQQKKQKLYPMKFSVYNDIHGNDDVFHSVTPCDSQPDDDDDPNGINIERPFDRSVNVEAVITEEENPLSPQVVTSQHITAQRVGLIITNNVTIDTTRLHTILQRHNYIVLELHSLSRDNISHVSKGITQLDLESFVLIYASQGPECTPYDVNHNEIEINELIDQFKQHEDCNRVFFFETFISLSCTSSSDTTTCTSPCISTSTVSLSNYLQRLHSTTTLNTFDEQHVCPLTASNMHHWYQIVQLPGNHSNTFHGTESLKGEKEFFTLRLITHTLTQMGTFLINHKKDVLKSTSSSSTHSLPILLSFTHAIITATLGEPSIIIKPPSLLLEATSLENQLVDIAKKVREILNTLSHGTLEELLQTCDDHVSEGFVKMIVESLNRKWEFPRKQLRKWEKSVMRAINSVEESFSAFSEGPENRQEEERRSMFPSYCSEGCTSEMRALEEESLLDNVIDEETIQNNEHHLVITAEVNEEIITHPVIAEEEETREIEVMAISEQVNASAERVQYMQNLRNNCQSLSGNNSIGVVNEEVVPCIMEDINNDIQESSEEDLLNEWVLVSYNIEDEWVLVPHNINEVPYTINEAFLFKVVDGEDGFSEVVKVPVFMNEIDDGYIEVNVG